MAENLLPYPELRHVEEVAGHNRTIGASLILPLSRSSRARVSRGFNPLLALLIGGWYGLMLSSALTTGVKYLESNHPGSDVLRGALCIAGSGLGAALATILATDYAVLAGVFSALIPSAVWGVVLALSDDLEVNFVWPVIGGIRLSMPQFIAGMLMASGVASLIGMLIGGYARDEKTRNIVVFAIRQRERRSQSATDECPPKHFGHRRHTFVTSEVFKVHSTFA